MKKYLVNIGIIGASFESITFLKFFAKYVSQYDIGYKIVKMDLGGRKDISYTQENFGKTTFHPNRVIVQNLTHTNHIHTLFSPIGSREFKIVQTVIKTITRISKHIILSVSLNQPLNEQLEYYTDVHYMPKIIDVWLLEREKLEENREKIIEETKNSLKIFFQNRKIAIRKYLHVNVEFMLL